MNNYEIIYRHQVSLTDVTGTLADDPSGDGAYKATVMVTLAGNYDLWVRLEGLEVPTGLVAGTMGGSNVTITPAETTSITTSNFTGIEQSYLTGQSVTIWVDARDVYGNLRPSSTDEFKLKVTGEQNSTVVGEVSTTNLNNGTHTATFMFTIVDSYTLQVTLTGSDTIGSPLPNIDILHSQVLPTHSGLYSSKVTIEAGSTQVWQIQAKDFWENVVLATEERFGLEVMDEADFTVVPVYAEV